MNKEYLKKELVNKIIKKAALEALNNPSENFNTIISKYFNNSSPVEMISNQLGKEEFTCLVEAKVNTFNTDLIQ